MTRIRGIPSSSQTDLQKVHVNHILVGVLYKKQSSLRSLIPSRRFFLATKNPLISLNISDTLQPAPVTFSSARHWWNRVQQPLCWLLDETHLFIYWINASTLWLVMLGYRDKLHSAWYIWGPVAAILQNSAQKRRRSIAHLIFYPIPVDAIWALCNP